MISVDSRVGSKELAKYFQPYGIVPELTTLEFGDFSFEGYGPKGLCSIVVERKQINDLLDSMKSGRLAGYQLPGLASAYDYGYLLVEGVWRLDKEGMVEVNSNGYWKQYGVQVRGMHNFIMGLALRAGMIPWRVGNPQETVAFIVDQYRMWSKPWAEHTSHDAVYAPAEAIGFGLNLRARKVSYAEKVAMQLPSLDFKARYIARYFKSIYKLATSSEAEWAKVPWVTKTGKERLLGEVAAKKIVAAIRGEGV